MKPNPRMILSLRSLLRVLLLLFVMLYCAKELQVGLSQLYGNKASNHFMYAITGSFGNPGPYGGFLAVGVSILGAWILSVKAKGKDNNMQKVLYWFVFVTVFFATVLLPSTQSRSAVLGLGCSAVLFATRNESVRRKLIPVVRRYGMIIGIGVLLLGTGAYLFKKPSADGRLFMDRISARTMLENGMIGVGTGHFGAAYGETQARYFERQIAERGKDDLDWRALNEHDRMTAECPDNAFNEYLFIGVENGLIAMLLFCGIILVSIVVAYRNNSVWCYGLTAFAVFALFSYPLHVWQFQILLPILVAACLLSADRSKRKESSVSIATLVLFLGCLSWTLFTRLPDMQQRKSAEKEWKKAERWHNMEYYEYVVEDCEPLLAYMKHDRGFLFAYGQSLNKTGQYEKSDSILKLGTEISSDPMFWNVMGNNSLALGRYREAEERYKHAFYMVPNRLYPLTLLAKLYHAEGDTVRFLDMAEKVETFVPKIENANTKRLREEIRDIKAGYTNNRKLTDE